jgi:hypothetical protein
MCPAPSGCVTACARRSSTCPVPQPTFRDGPRPATTAASTTLDMTIPTMRSTVRCGLERKVRVWERPDQIARQRSTNKERCRRIERRRERRHKVCHWPRSDAQICRVTVASRAPASAACVETSTWSVVGGIERAREILSGIVQP